MLKTMLKKSNKTYVILISVLFLISCKSMQIQVDDSLQFEKFNQTAWIEIKQELRVEANNARAYLQKGKQIHPASLNTMITDCEIEIRTVLEEVQIIYPGRFDIVSIGNEVSPIVFIKNTKVNVAFSGGGGAPMDVKRFWKFKLHSDKHPEVLNFICRGPLDMPSQAELPTIFDIKKAVGENIEVHLIDE
jgi:hypothetical protein